MRQFSTNGKKNVEHKLTSKQNLQDKTQKMHESEIHQDNLFYV